MIEEELTDFEILARSGGDEFFICFIDMEMDETLERATEILKKVTDSTILFEEEEIRVSISAGIAELRDRRINTLEYFINKADQNLYMAKRNGRGIIHTS